MTLHLLSLLALLLGCACAAPTVDDAAAKSAVPQDELNADASSYVRTYSNWGNGYPTNNYVTGYGLLDDKYNYNSGFNGYNTGYNGYSGYNGYAGDTGYTGYNGYNKGYGGYDSSATGGFGQSSFTEFGGNGGVNSYYGYNNPQYQGAYQHVGYGYRKPGFGNIYNSGITPSLVTGYRGYSRR